MYSRINSINFKLHSNSLFDFWSRLYWSLYRGLLYRFTCLSNFIIVVSYDLFSSFASHWVLFLLPVLLKRLFQNLLGIVLNLMMLLKIIYILQNSFSMYRW